MPESSEIVGFIGLGTMGRPIADALGTDAPLAGNMRARWAEANAALGPDADFTRAIEHWEPR